MLPIYQRDKTEAELVDIFLGSIPKDSQDTQLNGNIHITCAILKLVAASAAEAELGALFLNAQKAKNIRLTLLELRHLQ